MAYLFEDNIAGVLDSSINQSNTSFDVVFDGIAPTESSLWAANTKMYFTLVGIDQKNVEQSWEVVEVTAIGAKDSNNKMAFTVTRSSSPSSFTSGSKVECRLSAAAVNAYEAYDATLSSLGVSLFTLGLEVNANTVFSTNLLTYNNTWTGLNTFTAGLRSTGAGANSFRAGTDAGATTQGASAVAVGVNAGETGQGIYATAVGNLAGNDTQGYACTAIGYGAGQTDQEIHAVAVGELAGQTSQGTGSVAMGLYAGNVTQGDSSVAVGQGAGRTSQGNTSVAVGITAGQTTQGNNAVAVGVNAGNGTQGASSVAIGNAAGQTTQGGSSVAIGREAAKDSQGNYSVAVGVKAGETDQGNNGIIISSSGAALDDTTNGHIHIASDDGSIDFTSAGGWTATDSVGTFSLRSSGVQLGDNNTWTGNNTFTKAVSSVGAGASSLRLGSGGVGGTNQGNYTVALGNGAALTGQTEYAVAIGTGAGRTNQGSNSIGIGRGAGYTNQGDYGIIINSKGAQHNDTSEGHIILKSSQGELAFTQANGWNFSDSITCSGNITAYSDIRLKKEVSVISNPMDIVAGINGVKYTEIRTGKRRTGVIAQAVQEVLPEAVLEDSKGMLSVDYGNLVGVLFEAVKELKAEIEELKEAK